MNKFSYNGMFMWDKTITKKCKCFSIIQYPSWCRGTASRQISSMKIMSMTMI